MTRVDPSAATDLQLPTIGSVDDAYAFCRRVAHRYGANFSVGFRFLPKRKRDAVYATYAFCRWADDIADEPGEDVLERLGAWQRELDACYSGAPTHPVTIALADALTSFEIPRSAFVDLIDGCRQDLNKTRYDTFEELLGYCHLVATSISSMSLAIFGYRTPAAHEHGRNLATALQLTNIARDVGDDLQRDRIYIPREELERFGVTENQLIRREPSSRLRELLHFQIDRAEGYFRRAQPLLHELSFDSRFPTLLMGSVYSAVLRKLRREPEAALRIRTRLSTGEKIFVVGKALVRRRFA